MGCFNPTCLLAGSGEDLGVGGWDIAGASPQELWSLVGGGGGPEPLNNRVVLDLLLRVLFCCVNDVLDFATPPRRCSLIPWPVWPRYPGDRDLEL